MSIAPPTPQADRPSKAGRQPVDWRAVRALVEREARAIRRSKAIVLPMTMVPVVLLVLLPAATALAATLRRTSGVGRVLERIPGGFSETIAALPEAEQLVVLVNGYLLAPLFMIVPLMISAVLAADSFAGEKERKTMETLLHLPITDRDLFIAKLLGPFIAAVSVSWVGFALFCVVSNGLAWPVMHRFFVPTTLWMVMIVWVAPAIAAMGLGVMVRVSARANTTQEANQLGSAVVLPLIFLAVGQAGGLLLVGATVAIGIGAALWVVAILLIVRGSRLFTRDRLATRL